MKTNKSRYIFSEIPNDEDGREFVRLARKYLNSDRYQIRLRGQFVIDNLKSCGVTKHGQRIDQSKCLRVYIDDKTHTPNNISYDEINRAYLEGRRSGERLVKSYGQYKYDNLVNNLVKLINNEAEEI